MSKPIYITEVAERKPQYRGGISLCLDLFDRREDYEWYKKIYKKIHFTIPKINSKGEKLFYELCQAIKEKDEEKVKRIFPELEKNCLKNNDEKSEVERWGDAAVQLPGDWGPFGEKRKRLIQIIAEKAYGNVLEAMCGFESYFNKSEKIREVIALDFCREALERYSYPKRKRILYDLEKVVKGKRMDFFDNNYFNTIGVFFGVGYLTNPLPVYEEFHRILSQNGRLLIVGGTSSGYSDLIKKWFRPKTCSKILKSVGFSTKVKHLASLKQKTQLGEYYLVEAKKS